MSGDQPGWVECVFSDAHGCRWSVIEKLPVVCDAELDRTSDYPQPGVLGCEVVSQSAGVARVTTRRPWGIESTDGTDEFEVPTELLVEW
jgi:hypothetical protein